MVTLIEKGMMAPDAIGADEIDDEAISAIKDKLGITALLDRVGTLEGAPAPLSGLIDFQKFTANGTWAKPASVLDTDIIRIELIGGGGGGAAGSGSGNTGQTGGEGGDYIFAEFKASDVPASVSVTVHQGGAAVSRASGGKTAGTAGGDTSFGSLISTANAASPKDITTALTISAEVAPGQTTAPGTETGATRAGAAGAWSAGTAGPVGVSVYSGNGGGFGSPNGVAPGGGGSGVWVSGGAVTSGAGARGVCRVWIFR